MTLTGVLGLVLAWQAVGPSMSNRRGAFGLVVSDDGKWVAQSTIEHLWRVEDWRDFGPDRVFVLYDKRTKTPYAADYSQSSYLFKGIKGIKGTEGGLAFTIQSANLWGALHDLTSRQLEADYPDGKQLVSFLYRKKRGLHPNREVILDAGQLMSSHACRLAFKGEDALHVSEAQIANLPEAIRTRNLRAGMFRSWEIRVSGRVRLRFARPFSRVGAHYSAGSGKGMAQSTDGIAYISRLNPPELKYLRGRDGKTLTIPVPSEASLDRLDASVKDILVFSSKTGATLQYSLSKRTWKTIPGLEIAAVSGSGTYGAFMRLSDGRLTVRKL